MIRAINRNYPYDERYQYMTKLKLVQELNTQIKLGNKKTELRRNKLGQWFERKFGQEQKIIRQIQQERTFRCYI